ncbi:aldehyde dehydrogenase [Pontibacter diazotrophicus]|uniref:aldehyde dehydrogenase n=1 Tax=Pontibacter diazotrophicus TaxID=1400979 RepID=UPI001C6A7203|nr:aldehyde dehydrogenase [Pontibacter diazotrophicus]
MPVRHTAPTTVPPSGNDLLRIQQLVQKQRTFFATGKTKELDFRKEQLLQLQQAIRKHEQELIDAMYADFRKPEFESFISEIGFVELELKLTLKNIENWVKPKPVKEALLNFPSRSYVYSSPYGINLIIGPWNYPINLLITPLLGAMAAGNCIILKPSEIAANTSAVIAKMIRETFDEEYVAAVEGGVETTQHLLAQRFDHIFFTGSTRVGQIIMKSAAEHLTPVTLELGGKSPAIVAEDADLELAARRITWGKFLNAGQTCVAPDYLLVHEQVKEELVQLITQCITDFYGDDPDKSPDFARIINDSHYERLSGLLRQGTIRTGGQTDAKQRYIAPTLLDQVDWEHPVMQEEIFGPILPVLSYSNLAEAIELVNRGENPLALYFFSSSRKKQQTVLRCTQFGGGCINDTVSHLVNPNLPFGGVGGSGVGSYHGKSSFNVFSHQKSVLHRGTWLDLPLRYPPYQNRLPLLRRLFKWL